MPDTVPSREEVSELFVRKIRQKNFWACLFSDFEKVCDPSIPTLQIELAPNTLLGLALAYNPDFLRESLHETGDFSLFDFFIAHEGTHVIQRHIPRWLYYLVKKLKVAQEEIPAAVLRKANQAADLATNSACWKQACKKPGPPSWDYGKREVWEAEIKALFPPHLCWPEKFGFEPDLSMEQYLDLLLAQEDEKSSQLPQPEHSWIVRSPDDLPEGKSHDEHLDMLLRSVVEKATERFEKMHGRGSLPLGVKSPIGQQVEEPPKIPWQQVVNRLLNEVSEEHDNENFSRPNRRMWGLRAAGIFPYPRWDASSTCRVAFLIDTSGSMGLNTEIREAMSVIYSFIQYQKNSRFWIVNADTCVSTKGEGSPAVFDVRKKSDIPTHIWGRGGTDFGPPITWVINNLNPTLICYATDGCGPGPVVAPSVPLVWFLTAHGRIPHTPSNYSTSCGFGGVIRISTGEVIRRP
jgi:predicted metal-dependent peptidase